ncbi:hypothetical protein QQX10_07515 [Demequina sp. SYSU T00039]|uniref:Uncharacterized protein n=1 Tax=Demequina lignilytica TaxID=3051663 RepID=A0AAW7M114_9MICO|nr:MULTISPECIES: hypothetical protein [unclassified Demequina]MDN4477635.1 hypothetical protein [Demequina sp. SYSU T00039-1]MDN4488014.1 hypothetical protein [Demequina sp. SYSU T00039]
MFSDGNGQQTALQSAQKALAGNISDGELATLARSPEAKVRAAAAAHPGTPIITLLKLAQDVNADVRIGVASNPRQGIPVELFEDLAKDKNVDVVYALIGNPAVPDPVIARLGRQIHKEYAKHARARLAEAKRYGAAAAPAPAVPAAAAEVPAFPPTHPASVGERAPIVAAHRVRDDALDALLGKG